jgi:hypothetical protein
MIFPWMFEGVPQVPKAKRIGQPHLILCLALYFYYKVMVVRESFKKLYFVGFALLFGSLYVPCMLGFKCVSNKFLMGGPKYIVLKGFGWY